MEGTENGWTGKKAPIFEEGEYIDYYRIQQHIGSGGFGQLYVVVDVRTDKLWAMKVERTGENQEENQQVPGKTGETHADENDDAEDGQGEADESRKGNTLETEVEALMKCANKHGKEHWFPHIKEEDSLRKIWPEVTRNGMYMIQELLGPSVNDFYKTMGRIQNPPFIDLTESRDEEIQEKILIIHTTLRVALRMIECIDKFCGLEKPKNPEKNQQAPWNIYVHRDIKPENFLIRNNRKEPICLIDFGLALERRQDEELSSGVTDEHSMGTEKYMSVRAHRGMDLVPLDDVVSWYYSVASLFFRGLTRDDLPWSRMESTVIEKEKRELAASHDKLSGFCRQMLGMPNNKKKPEGREETGKHGQSMPSPRETLDGMRQCVSEAFANFGKDIFEALDSMQGKKTHKYDNDFEIIDRIKKELKSLIDKYGGDDGPYCWEGSQMEKLTEDVIAEISMIDLKNHRSETSDSDTDDESDSDSEWWKSAEDEVKSGDDCNVA